jgi:tRNA nucleotidyltransferase/poly(A) polymerase
MISSAKLKKIILSDKYNSIIFEKGRRRNVYLVGGYVRDLLRGCHSQDRDYIVSGDIMSLVKEIKDQIGGTIVTFKKGGTTRIATKNGLTFDFSKPLGTIDEDLSKRDFTINAIAWSAHKGIIDLFHGIEDIQNKKIRVIRKKNIIDDPLRMIRAYRFAAEIEGHVEKGTRQLIKILNNNIKETSYERITLEIFQLLNQNQSSKHIKTAFSDGLLNNIFLITSKVLAQNIKQISLFEKLTLNKLSTTFKVKLKEIISQNLTYKGFLCFALLVKDYSKDNYLNHKLKLSKRIIKRLKLIQGGIGEKIIKGKSFDIYMNSKDAAIDILILKNRIDCLKDYRRFLRIWEKGILSSEDVIRYSGIDSGENIGSIIKEAKRAQYEGRVRTKVSGINLIKKLSCNI